MGNDAHMHTHTLSGLKDAIQFGRQKGMHAQSN